MVAPLLSVVVACQGAGDDLVPCLTSLAAQRGLRSAALEVLVAIHAADASEALLARFPGVRLVQATASRSLPRLLGAGMAQARGRLVALSEAHCRFPADWALQAVAQSLALGPVVLGGAVVAAEDLTSWQRALFLCDYAAFLPPFTAGPTHELPGNNIVFPRELLPGVAELSEQGFWKSFFCQRLARQGVALRRSPELVVVYRRQLSWLAIVRRRLDHGRCFGAMRRGQMSRLRRWCYPLAAPALPALLSWRLRRQIAAHPARWGTLLRSLPALVLLVTLWVAGELFGHIAGAGQSCARV